jgi:hypothetical protein
MTIITINHINYGTADNSLPTSVYDLNHIDSLQSAVYIKEAVVQFIIPVDEFDDTFFRCFGDVMYFVMLAIGVACIIIALLYLFGFIMYSFIFG